ncbi:MAG: GNAT family N-acetyltransferase [Bacteroidota bacterium]
MSNQATYRFFCERESGVPIFSQPWYLDTICGEKGWDVVLVKKGNEIAATMPFEVKQKFGIPVSSIPTLIRYWGPFFPKKINTSKQQQKLTQRLIQSLPKLGWFEQHLHPDFKNALPYFWEKFTVRPRYTFILDLEKPLETIYKNVSSNYRNNKITKAKKIIKFTTDKSVADFYTIQKKTFNRQGIAPPFTLDFLKKYHQALSENKAGKMFFAIDAEDRIHSAAYLIWDDHTAYLSMVGDDDKLRSSGAGIYLTWYLIEYSKHVLGKQTFDFLGSMIEPITKVRRSFGAVQTPYLHVKKFNSIVLRVLSLFR